MSQPLDSARMISCTLLIALAAHAGKLEDFTRYTPQDSLLLRTVTAERFVWKTGIDGPYTVLRPRGGEVKGLLMLLHGAGDNPTNFSKIGLRLALPAFEHILPRAPFATAVRIPDPATGNPSDYAGYTWLQEDSHQWVDRGAALSVFLIDQILEQCSPEHAAGPPLFVMGLRQGAGIAAMWASIKPRRVRGLILVSGHADTTTRAALLLPGLALSDVPCLLMNGVDAADSTDRSNLGLLVRGLGAQVETHYLPRSGELGEEEYQLVREFIWRHVESTQSPSSP